MARGFNLTAQINLQGPSNIRTVVANIRRQIGTISSNVNLNIDPASVRTVAGLNSSLTQLNATLRTTASSATNVAQAMRDMMNAMRGVAAVRMPNHAGQISSALQGVQASARGAQSAVAGSRTEIEEFGNQAGLAVRRFAAFSSSTILIYGLVGAIKSGISEFISFDRQITRISQVTGESKENLGKLQGTIASLSGQLGVAAKDLATVAVTLSQAGLTARDTETALNALALSALTPSFDNMNQTVEGSIALMRQFKISANDLEGALGSINAVSAKFAVESSDIIAAIQRTGGVFAAASKGVSEGTDALNEFIAVFTSVRATTRESAETIATGLRTIFTRIQRGDTIEALKEYGVNLTDLDGKFVGAYRAVQLLSEGLGRIDSRDLKFSNIVEELGGFRQIGKVIPLIQEFATAQDALKVAQAGQGSLATDAAKGQLALAVQISKTREEFLTLIRSVGNTDSFQKMVTVGLSLASAFIKVADAAKELLPIITLFAAVKGASAITQFASGFGRGFTGGGRRNNTPGFASGGLVPGQGNSDSVAARLTPGEFVIRKSAVKAIGSNNLHRLNRANGGRIQKFSNGGLTQSYTIDQLLTRDGSATISKALGKTNIEAVGDSAKIRIVPRPLELKPADFKKIWDMASEKASTSKRYRSYAGVDVSGENREKLERTIQFAKSQKTRKRAVSDKETEVGKLGSAENRWGKAYESLIISRLKQGWAPASNKSNYPVDLLQIGKNQAIQKIGEAKFKTSNTEDIDLVSKMLRYRIDKKQVGVAGSKNGLFTENDKKDTDPNVFLGDLDYFWAADQKDKFYSWVQTQQKNKVPGFNLGGSVRKFVDAGIVTPTSGKTASSSEIFRVLTANDAVRLTGMSIGEIQKILKKRNTLSSSEKAIKDKILAEYTKKSSGIQTANNLDIEKATTEGLLFGAAGFKGRAFPTTDRMDIPGLKNPVKVRITSGVLDKEAAGRDIKRMTQAMSGVSAKSTKNIQIRDLLKQVGPIYSDFDRTLAFGADKILSDPKTPRFSEFADRNKVSDALNKATLSKLGRALVDQVRKTPEFLNNLHVISARPQSTMDLIGAWLAKNKLPIPASRIKGVGGPDRTAEQIAKFKLQEMDTSGSFIDDDKRNVDIAKAAGMNTYLYKDKKVKASDRKKMGEANAQGYMAESIIHQLGGPIGNKAATNYGIDFPDGLQDAAKYFKLPPNIPTDAKLTLNGPAELKGQIGNYLKARGYADGGLVPGVGSQDTVPANLNVGDFVIRKKAVQTIGANKLSSLNRKAAGGSINTTVPALLTPGEFVINRKTASKIGTPTLNRLNHADKVSGFNSGGLVGGVQEFATGGAVQRLFFGGRAGPAARPNTINTETIGVSGNTAQRLSELAEVLSELGVASSRSGQLLRRGYQATAAEAERAYNADILMARAAGASATVLYDLQRALQQSQQEARNEVRIRQQLGNVNGRQIQEALSMVDEELERLTVTARAAATAAGTLTDEEVEAEVRAGAGARRTQAFENVNASGVLTGVGGGVDLAGIGATGDDLERTMMALMRDADTLEQMNQEYIRQRRQAMAEEARLAGDTARAARIRAGSERDVEQVIAAEVRARRQAVQEAANAAGSRDTGTRDRNGGNRGLLMAGGIITVGSLIGQQMDTKSSAGQAAGAVGLQTASQSAGVAIGVISQLGDLEQHLRDAGTAASEMGANAVRAAGRLLTVGAAVFTTIAVIKDMANAMNEFKLEVEAKKLEFAMKGIEQEFEILRKDIKAVDFTRLNNQLEAASTAFANQINILGTRTLYTFTNLFDTINTFMSGGVGGQEGLQKRSDILRLGGSEAYYRSRSSTQDTSIEFNKIIPQLAQEQAAMGRGLADSLLESFRERAKRGASVTDITSDPNFGKFSESLANADVVIRQKILELQNSGLDAADIEKIKEGIIKSAGEDKARQQVNIVLREKEAQALQRSTYVFTGSLNRMFKNMEQAISATSNALDNMQKSIDANISSLTGSASLQNISSQTSNIISNPRGYSQASVSQAQSTGAGFFGQSSGLVQSLLKVGETAENVIMKTINDTIQQNPEANDEVVGSKITANINKALQALGLPPEFVDKLSGQIGKAISDLRKSGDDKISFGDLQEKVAGLSSTLDTAKSVSDIVVKALDNFNNALNVYSSNINKIIDLEISSREKLRRAEDILINSGLELAKTFGESVNLEQSRARAQAKTSKLTGGPTDPNGIFNQILKLNTEKSIAESSRSQAGERGAAGADDFTKFSKDVQNNSVALRESYNALRLLADNSDSASEAMQKIQDAQQRNAGKVSFIEKLATSTPEEAASLGNALSRLQKNINGQINTINNSVGAQQAYFEALRNGASGFEAMRAAQTAFANERKETLSALQDIMPFLGEGKQASNIRASALESMLKESGMGISPMMMDVLNNLRNPQADPAIASAMSYYNDSVALQSSANEYLAKIDQHLAQDTAEANAKALASALSGVTLTFFNQELKDIAANINNLVPIQPQARAAGGVIYAAGGQMVNFQPKGSDTVPAMLTPGEFVVNKKAASNNRSLLESINSHKYSSGGSVRYYAKGGFVHDRGSVEALTKSDSISREDLLNLDQKNVIDDLLKSQGNLFETPHVYTFLNSRKQTPKQNARTGYDLSELEPDHGTVVPGMGPIIGRVDGTQADYQIDAREENLLRRFNAFKTVSDEEFYHVNALNTDSFNTKKIKELDWEDYKRKANSQNINWNLQEIELNSDRFGPIPKIADFKLRNPNIFNSNIIDKPYGIINSDSADGFPNLDNAATQMYQIWEATRGTGLKENAISVQYPNFDIGTPKAGLTFKPKPTVGSNLVIQNLNKNVIPYSKFTDLNTKSSEAYEKYRKTAEFLRNPNPPFVDSPNNDPDSLMIRTKLSKIYDNSSIGESIDGNGILKKYFSGIENTDKANSLLILQDTATEALNKSIEEFTANPGEANKRNIVFSGPGLKPLGPFVKDTPINIYSVDKDSNIDKPLKSFPYVVNGSLEDLDPSLRKQMEEQVAANNPGRISMKRLPAETISIPLDNFLNHLAPMARIAAGDAFATGNNNVDLKVAYDEWKGNLYNPNTRQFDVNNQKTLFLPAKVNKTLFESLDANELNKRRVGETLFNTKFSDQAIKDSISDGSGANIDKNFENYIKQVVNKTPDNGERKTLSDSLNSKFTKSWLKSQDMVLPNLDVLLTNPSNSPVSFNVGDHILQAMDAVRLQSAEGADLIEGKPLGSTGINDKDIPRAVRDTAKSALNIFGRAKVPGLGFGWLARYIGKIPNMVNMKPDIAKNLAAYASGVMEQFGSYLSSIGTQSRDPNQYQGLKELWTLASGASQAFSGLANGSTSLFGQFQFNDLSMADLFRTLGTGTLMRRITGLALNDDWKNLLSGMLGKNSGTTRKVGANILGPQQNLENNIPTTLQELIDLVFNPYTEFTDQNTRSNLMTKLQDDLKNLKEPNGVRYFDNNTMSFINENIEDLKKWYGGEGFGWPGQDYLFDKQKGIPADTRANTFLASTALPFGFPEIYKEANDAQVSLGLGNKFGRLPSPDWFKKRIAQGLQTGGMVYAANGGEMIHFQPRGTDTVPAMLTPGEFVINRKATQENLPLLKAINQGGGPKALSKGGVIYAQNGGMTDMSGGGPSNAREAYLEAERQANRTKVQQKAQQEALVKEQSRMLQEFQKDMQLLEQSLTEDFVNLADPKKFPDMHYENRSKALAQLGSQADIIRGKNAQIFIAAGKDRLLGTNDDTSPKPDMDTPERLSLTYSTLGLIPGAGLPFDVAATITDLLRGDLTSAGLSAAGIVPGIGGAAGAAKIAGATGAVKTGLAGASFAAFGSKAGKATIKINGLNATDDIIREIREKFIKPGFKHNTLGDPTKVIGKEMIEEAAVIQKQFYEELKALDGVVDKDSVARIFDKAEDGLFNLSMNDKYHNLYPRTLKPLQDILYENRKRILGIDEAEDVVDNLAGASKATKAGSAPTPTPINSERTRSIASRLKSAAITTGVVSAASLAGFGIYDQFQIAGAARTKYSQDELEKSYPKPRVPEEPKDNDPNKPADPNKADGKTPDELKIIKDIQNKFMNRLGPVKKKELDSEKDLQKRQKLYQDTEKLLDFSPALTYKNKGGVVYLEKGGDELLYGSGGKSGYEARKAYNPNAIPAKRRPEKKERLDINSVKQDAMELWKLKTLLGIYRTQASKEDELSKDKTLGDNKQIPKIDPSSKTIWEELYPIFTKLESKYKKFYPQRKPLDDNDKNQLQTRYGLGDKDFPDKNRKYTYPGIIQRENDGKTKLPSKTVEEKFGRSSLNLDSSLVNETVVSDILPTLDDTKLNMSVLEYTINKKLEELNSTQDLQTKSSGGIVYASMGKLINFQPRGTDTVPAMLTPGEFVVNAKATRNNIDLLKSINSGGDSKSYSSGGVVYLAGGGLPEESTRELDRVKQAFTVLANSEFPKLDDLRTRGEDRKKNGRVVSTIRGKDGQVQVVEQPTDEQMVKERKQRDQKTKEDKDEYNSAENREKRKQYIQEIKENQPKVQQAFKNADLFREQLSAIKLEYIKNTEEKIQKTAKELGVTVVELLQANPEARAEMDFIRGKIGVSKLGETGHQQLMDALSELGNANDLNIRLVGLGFDKINELVSVSSETIRGTRSPQLQRSAFFNETGARELYTLGGNNFSSFDPILPSNFDYKDGSVIGPTNIKEMREEKERAAAGMSTGGVVYASKGKLIPYEPKGTDTVPAMLTPGEFVVNRSATQKNLSLLKAINSGKTQGYSNGGVVYLFGGGQSKEDRKQRKDDYDKEMQDRRDNSKNMIMERGLANSPNGALIMQIKKQAEDSSQLFEALDSEAINEGLTAQGLAEKYWKVWGPLEKENASELVRNAKIQYEVDKKRFNYLKEIYTNSSQAYATLKGDTKARNILVPGKNGPKSIIDILAGQEVAKKEGTAIEEGWKFLFKTYTVLNGANQAGSSAAGNTVAGEEKQVPPTNKQYGGMIYANHGMMIPYIPRGSDTVPAMLTPGEFVVNRASAQQNLPLLQAINNNRYNRGGSVKYLANGGMADGSGGGVSNGGGSSSPNMDGLSQFTTKFAEFIGQLKAINLPPVINVTGNHKVEVVINGASVFEKLEPSVSALVVSEVNKAMGTLSDQTEGALGRK